MSQLNIDRNVCLRYFLALGLAILIQIPVPLVLASAAGGSGVAVSPNLALARRKMQPSSLSGTGFAVESELIRQISLTTNDVVYNQATKKLYLSVPSAAGASGNSIIALDPATGVADAPVFIGSEPNKLALSNDGTALYVGLDGAAAVRRFDTTNKTAGLQFAVGRSSTGTFFVNDLAVLPGSQGAVAVSRKYIGVSPSNAGVAIYDDGVPRPSVANPGANLIEFSASASTLYGYSAGGSGAFYKLAVDNNGTSLTSEFNPGIQFSGLDLKFDNGLLYTEYGKVINPTTQLLAGTYPGVVPTLGSITLVAPDSTVGRTYFLTGGGSNWTLRAFDQTTFQQLGTLDVTGITGTPGSLVRWGTNGIAFRTSGNQLFLIQTSLIPSADPIPTPSTTPTPSPTPTPTPPAVFVRTVPLAASDLVLDQSSQTLYASLPSSAGNLGNTLTQIHPGSGQVGSSFFIGSEPSKMALAEDGHSGYVLLDGAAAVRRFDLATKSAGIQFPVGTDSTSLILSGSDLAVQPGNPNVVAVSRRAQGYGAGVAIYDNGVQRPVTAYSGGSRLEFSSSPSVLYGTDFTFSGFQQMSVDGSGVTFVSNSYVPGFGDFRFADGLIYSPTGHVMDPVTLTLKGKFISFDLGTNSVVLPDSANQRVYFVTENGKLHVFDMNTFLEIGSVSLGATARNLVRWGTNGLAFSNGFQVVIVQTSLVASGSVPTPTPTPSPTPSPSPVVPVAAIRQLTQPANDIVYSPVTKLIYASVPNSAGAGGNSIVPINPGSGVVETPAPVGSDPNRLALADDGTTLYVGLDGTPAVRRFDITTQTAGLQFTLGPDVFGNPLRAGDMRVMPGRPQTVVVSKRCGCSPSYGGTTVYDDGVPRPISLPDHTGPNLIEFSASPAILYGSANETSSLFYKLAIDSSGISQVKKTAELLYADIRFDNGLIYSANGRVADPEAPQLLGTFSGASGPVRPESALGRVYYLTYDFSTSTYFLRAYDQATFRLLGAVAIPGVSGNPTSLIRWGTNGLAFRTSDGQIFLIQTELVPSADPIPTFVQFGKATYSRSESGASVSINVVRTGDISGASAVDYATNSGTATPGQDYTPVSGTVAFAAGETSKTFIIPLSSDNIFEGNETVNLELHNATNGSQIVFPTSAQLTIVDDDFQPALLVNNVVTQEPGSGSTTAVFTVSLSNPTTQTVTVAYNTSDGSATAGSDYVAGSGTLTFNPLETSKTVAVTINSDANTEPPEDFFLNLTSPTNAFIGTPSARGTIRDYIPPTIALGSASYSVNETANSITVNVTRGGDTLTAVTVDFATSDLTAHQQSDYTLAAGTLTFAAGESSKSFIVLITDDVYVEGSETLTLSLTNPKGGAILGSPATATLTITDDDSTPPTGNPNDEAHYFVSRHYNDFLSRVPDPGGLDYWSGQITQCGSDQNCLRTKRVDVSNAFFYELEYQQTGSYVYRLYRAAFGNNQPHPNPDPPNPVEAAKLPAYAVFAADRARVVGGASLVQSQLDLAIAFVQRPEFLTKYPASLDGPGFVDAVSATIMNDIGVSLASQRQALIDVFNQAGGGNSGRGNVLYRLADDAQSNPINNRLFIDAEYNRAFVATQYFGYLRRDPDMGGFVFWLGQISSAPLRDVNKQHAMVCSFNTSAEYQLRFSSVVTHFNSECQ